MPGKDAKLGLMQLQGKKQGGHYVMMQGQLQVQQAAAGPTTSERDAVALLRIVWDYQEVRRLGWVTLHQLQEESGLGWPRFTPAMNLLLECPRIVQTKAGGLEYTW